MLHPEGAASNRDDRDTFSSLAIAQHGLDRIAAAIELCEQNLAGHPSVEVLYAYAEALLLVGRLPDGWHHYEVRWLREPSLSLRLGSAWPPWAGQDLRGRTILLRSEQGFGDTIQFVRYASHVKALGATVFLDVFRDLKSLAASCAGVDRVFSHGDAVPPFDYHVHLMSLPRVFGTDLESIPSDLPYLHAEPALQARWATRLGRDADLRVGLVWAGRPEHARDLDRSMPLQTLAPLLGVDGLRFFSLQKGPAAAQAEALAGNPRFIDLGPELNNFSDTAAVVSQLDLVICVDTSVGHLAGALGVPVWLMVQKVPDWRWLLEREDSPWYPTMRLFRQSRLGDWSDVIERIKAALEERVRSGSVEPAAAKRATSAPLLPQVALARLSPGHRPGFSAVTETRFGILQYFPEEPIVGDSIDWYGEYLQPQLDVLASLIRAGHVVMEMGAGVGLHAQFLATAIGPSGHLFLYEPQPLMRRVLGQNLAANKIGNVTLIERALGRGTEPHETAQTTETLDELRLEQLHLLKLNAEVDALEVLAGAEKMLWRLRPLLFVAMPGETVPEELVARARNFGYRCWLLQTALFNRANFNRRENDIFGGATRAALLATPEEAVLGVALDGCVEL